MELSRFGPPIVNADLNENVFGRFLRVLHIHIEVAVFIEDAGIDQLVLELMAAPLAIGFDEEFVRIRCVRKLMPFSMLCTVMDDFRSFPINGLE